MTVSTTVSKKVYAGNGVTTAFATTFQFFDNTDIVVTLVVDATGVETVQTLTTHYTVSGGDGSTGTVTMLAAPASGQTLVIDRAVPYTQGVDYINNDSFPADAHELALDRLTLLSQQAYTEARGSPALPITFQPGVDTQPIIPLPETSKVLVGNADEDGWDNATITDLVTINGIAVTITSAAAGDLLMFNGSVWVDATTLTGNYTVSGALAVPTVSAGDNDTSAASTEFVHTAISRLLGGSNANLSPDLTYRRIEMTNLSTARTVTLPLANSVPAGSTIEIVADDSPTQTNTISLVRSGSNTINGSSANQVCINIPYGSCIVMSNGSSKWYVVKWSVVYTNIATGDTNMDNTGSWFTGATVNVGATGTWEVVGGITMGATDATQPINGRLGDGTTQMASGRASTRAANEYITMTLSGRISAPAAALVMQGNSPATSAGVIKFNASGMSADTWIKATRVA